MLLVPLECITGLHENRMTSSHVRRPARFCYTFPVLNQNFVCVSNENLSQKYLPTEIFFSYENAINYTDMAGNFVEDGILN